MDETYEDCDICGERYHGADIERYMKEHVRRPGTPEEEWYWSCSDHKEDK